MKKADTIEIVDTPLDPNQLDLKKYSRLDQYYILKT